MLKSPATGTFCSESGKNAIRGFSQSVLCKVKLRSLYLEPFMSWALDPLPSSRNNNATLYRNLGKSTQNVAKDTLSLSVKLVLFFVSNLDLAEEVEPFCLIHHEIPTCEVSFPACGHQEGQPL